MMLALKSYHTIEKNDEISGAHIIDSPLFGDGYSTAESKAIFTDKARLSRWMAVEVALAESQAELGIIPQEAAKAIALSNDIHDIDLEKVRLEFNKTKHSLLPLLKVWQQLLSPEHAQYLHFGATTQDIQDTAQVLELREVIVIIERDLKSLIHVLTSLVDENRILVMAGRTHAQHALPMTLGLKIAAWLDECMRHFTRLSECKNKLLVSQLFGGVGSMAGLGDQARELLSVFSAKLGLQEPSSCWHSARDRFVEYLAVVGLIGGTLGKIANEVIQLSKDEIAELAEPFLEGQVGSSVMPHKRNPEICERICALATLIKSNVGVGFDSLMAEHERDYRSIRLEWVSVS